MQNYRQKSGFVILLLIFGGFVFGCNTSAGNEDGLNQNEVLENSALTVSLDATSDNGNSVITSENAGEKTNASPTPNEADSKKIINRYLAGVAKVSGASEYVEARKIVYGDLDGDSDDGAVQFSIEGMGGDNYYAFYLAVFRNENGKLKPLT
ncbi:MAG: hypothetical protein ABR566_07755 [Pyrinomonadaceae bacterium]